MIPDTAQNGPAQDITAEQWFAVVQQIHKIASLDPRMSDNPAWLEARAFAHAEFEKAFTA